MLRLIRYERHTCGCLLVCFQNTETDRESAIVEAPSAACPAHRRNDLVDPPSQSPFSRVFQFLARPLHVA